MSKQIEIDFNASIVDQRVVGLVADHPEWFPDGDEDKKKSAAFVLSCMAALLDIPLEDALNFMTDGGNDAGIDGIFIGDVEDGEFQVTLFQGKYKVKDLRGVAAFPERDVQHMAQTVAALFDPGRPVDLNPQILPRIEEIRSLVRDGYIPVICIVLCNNGAIWTEQAQNWIDREGLPPDQVTWKHFNHDSLVEILKKTRTVDDSIKLTGQAIIEDFNFRRVLLGKTSVREIAQLFDRHGDSLLERNIRRYLGLHSNRVNSAIYDTLHNEQQRENFYFFNNGITIICRKFRHNALQGADYVVKIEGMQIINGGQTCKTIQLALANLPEAAWDSTFVLARIYELADDDREFVKDITYATNSQNPVDLRDLHSNDEWQKSLEIGLRDLGYIYKRQREDGVSGSNVITSSIVAEAVLAIWRMKPQQAKFMRNEHFNRLYDEIFNGLNAAQALLAVMIFRSVENTRKRPGMENVPAFLPYASHYLAMIIGLKLLSDNKTTSRLVSHRNYPELIKAFQEHEESYHQRAVELISLALDELYGESEISLQQLAATFRRGDLLFYAVSNVSKALRSAATGLSNTLPKV